MYRQNRSSTPRTNPYDAKGFDEWFKPISTLEPLEYEVFLLDFKTQIFQEEVLETETPEDSDDFDNEDSERTIITKYQDVSGLILFFLTFDQKANSYVKTKAFIKQFPYFYLLVDDAANPNVIMQQIRDDYKDRILDLEIVSKFDAGDILFLKEKRFIKVSVSVPNLVPALRERLVTYKGIIEWREADIQYHHRVAIDNKLNVGNWYKLTVDGIFVTKISESSRKDIPSLKLIAYDIETNNDRTREPNPEKDIITMVTVYAGNDLPEENIVIVNAHEIDCTAVTNFHIVIRKENEEYDNDWIDWCSESELSAKKTDPTVLSTYPMKVLIVKDEKELILQFLDYIQRNKPEIIADFFGDKFDLPFFNVRALKYGIDFTRITNFKFNKKLEKKEIINWMQDVDFVSSNGVFHIDAYLWNFKYSYLPKKDLGLKASVARKLKLIPISRESLWQLGSDEGNPFEAVAYAGSDGYVTWRYVKEIIMDFAISMGRMFPVNSSEILTKTAGALDDLLVDSIGYHRKIVAKQRFNQLGIGLFNSKMNIQGITYTGGFVTAPNPGIWRKDIKYDVKINNDTYSELKNILKSNLEGIEKKTLNKSKKSFFDKNIRQYFSNDEQYYAYTNTSSYNDCLEKTNEIFNQHNPEVLAKIKEEYIKADSLVIVDAEKKREELFIAIDNIINDSGSKSFKGLHLDVTSMYPSQIRQYKLQPSGIVHPDYCNSCEKKEQNKEGRTICAMDSPWTGKIIINKPCIHKVRDNKTPSGYCELLQTACPHQYAEETACSDYNMGPEKDISTEEFYSLSETKEIQVFILDDNNSFKEIPLKESYFARGFKSDQVNSKYLLSFFENWVKTSINGAQINYDGNYPFRIEKVKMKPIQWKGFMYIDVKQKNSSMLVSLKSRFCQKAYDYMSSIMDMFFQERVSHKRESKRLSVIINDKLKRKDIVPEDLVQRQKYHDSTQLGLKVPLNSIYGLLGMKAGVHNASLPSAGVTTSLSARLIQWSANLLSGFGPITELDTDGIWFWLPESLPTHYKIEVGLAKNDTIEVVDGQVIPVLEEYLNFKVRKEKSNDYYWSNDGKSITHSPKSLLAFEQDGPYDFQYVQGKKKYIVFNRKNNGNWEEEELTGLETKRADFSQLHKELQEIIINTFLEDWQQISLKELYQKAINKVDTFISRIKNGELDEEYFIQPKTIKKRPEEYFSQGPEVIAAYMLKDLGFGVEPGIRVDYFLIKPVKDTKNNIEIKVAPQQLFKLPYDEIVRFLKKRGIARLEFQLGQIKNIDDIRKKVLRIDYDEYIKSLTGPGKISERMIYSVAKKQNVVLSKVDNTIENKLEDLIEATDIQVNSPKVVVTEAKQENILVESAHTLRSELRELKQRKPVIYETQSPVKTSMVTEVYPTSSQKPGSDLDNFLSFQDKLSNDKNNGINFDQKIKKPKETTLFEKNPPQEPSKKISEANNMNLLAHQTLVKTKKDTLLLNNFIDNEYLRKVNKFVESSNVRINNILPNLNFYSQEKEKYFCKCCNESYSNISVYLCPHCNSRLQYEF